MSTRRISVAALGALVALGFASQAASAQAQARQKANAKGIKHTLTAKDKARLSRNAVRFEREIRAKYTPVVDLHIVEGNKAQWQKTSNPRTGAKGPTIFNISGLGTSGKLSVVGTFGASGHVMQQTYGGRPMSTVEEYGKSDLIQLTFKPAGATKSLRILNEPSRGLVTQVPVTLQLKKGKNTVYYWRKGRNGFGSGGEGSEPELRQVVFNWNGK